MIRSYLLVALRNLRKHRMFSLINVAGLALGLACFLLIAYFVRFERGFDRFHQNRRDIYLVFRDNQSGDYQFSKGITGAPLGPILAANVPQVRDVIRLTRFDGLLLRAGDRKLLEDGFVFADPSVLSVFTFPLVRGDAATALRDPNSLVLTGRAARKYFGAEDPVGRVLQLVWRGRMVDFRVTGVLRDIPAQSSLAFDLLASYSSLPPLVGEWFMTRHWDSPTWTYVRLAPGADPVAVDALLARITERFVDKQTWTKIGHRLMRLEDAYFKAPGPAIGPRGSAALLVILSGISIFILLIAGFNFMNLSTSRSGSRAKEIGLRKTAGARKGQLVAQFLGESVLNSLIALALALGLARLALPVFRAFVGRAVTMDYFRDLPFLGLMVLAAVLLGALAGVYPAFVLSTFRPVTVVRGRVETGRTAAARVRKALVVVQFAMSISLVAMMIIILRQVDFLKTMDLGFDRTGVVSVPIRDSQVRDAYPLLKARWAEEPGVLGVTASAKKPGVEDVNGVNVQAYKVDDQDVGILYCDPDYVRTMGLKIVAGRDFAPGNPNDARGGILVNRAFLEDYGWRMDEAPGQPMLLYFKEGGRKVGLRQVEVLGVVEDFHFRDLTTGNQPILIQPSPGGGNGYRHILVRVAVPRLKETVAAMERSWNGFQFPQPFESRPLDDDIVAVLRDVENFASVARASAAVAIFVACLGLFGLASYTIEKRTKEIGVRKVMGASVPRLVEIISREFLALVAAANLLAWPAALWFQDYFLRRFSNRVPGGLWTLPAAGAIAIAVAFLTVGGKSIRAALADPVESLRYE